MKIFLLLLFSLLSFAQVGNFIPGGQQSVTGSAVELPSFTVSTTCLKVLSTGTQTVFLGGSNVTTSNGFPLEPGASTCFQINNLNRIWVIAASTGSTIAWYGIH